MGLSFHLFTGGIFPGVYTILAVAAPGTDVHASGGASFVCQGQDECLGVEWVLCMGIYCCRFLAGGVGPGIRSILAMADPWDDILATDGGYFVSWGRIECLGVEWDFFWALFSSRG